MAADRTHWWDTHLSKSQSAAKFRIGETDALFCARTQRLSAINTTASVIWDALEATGSCERTAATLFDLGVSAVDADQYVSATTGDWLSAGYFFPTDIRARPTAAIQRHAAGPTTFEIRYLGDADPACGREVFGLLAPASAEPDIVLEVAGDGAFDVLFAGSECLGMHPREEIVGVLKAHVTDACCKAPAEGFLTHGALVSSDGKRVLLAGAPGAGKTTLTLSLAAAGFAYGGDDIIFVTEDGLAEGVPFAAATKAGAWPLLSEAYPSLMELNERLRTDGKHVRYVRPHRVDRDGPKPIDAVLLLAREEGKAPRLDPIAPVEALCYLIDSSFSHRGRIEAAALMAFADTISNARCYRFTYGQLSPAVDAVKALYRA